MPPDTATCDNVTPDSLAAGQDPQATTQGGDFSDHNTAQTDLPDRGARGAGLAGGDGRGHAGARRR